MELVDEKGKYIFEIDTIRRIVYEKPMGYWKPEDVERYHHDYVHKVLPILKQGPWAKCVELRMYKASMITEDLQEHVKWAVENGFSKGTMITDKENLGSVIELQMYQSVQALDIEVRGFSSREDCYDWLETQGF